MPLAHLRPVLAAGLMLAVYRGNCENYIISVVSVLENAATELSNNTKS